MIKKYDRECPKCGKILYYTNIKNRNYAEKKEKLCQSCTRKEVLSRPDIYQKNKEHLNIVRRRRRSRAAKPPFTRKCPVCGRELVYSNVKHRNRADKKCTMCMSCKSKEVGARVEVKQERSERAKKRTGHKNSFYGKKHTQETKDKLRNMNKSYTQTPEFRKKSARIGKNNGMYGKSFYDVWKDKFGEKIAEEKYTKWLEVQSQNSSGENNPMYGKPSPSGSGGGWSGWYKGWYFRSLRELSYMVKVIEKEGLKWTSAETKDLSIPYIDYNGNFRTYRADFLIDSKYLIEIKPEKLMNLPSNILKKKAAIDFCNSLGMIYKMVDVEILETLQIVQLFMDKQIVFTKKYQKRMQELCEKMTHKQLA